MQTLNFVVTTLLHAYATILLLRVWMQWARADFYNPFAQFVVKATQPVVRPLRRIIPAIGPIDTASVLVAYVAVLLKLLFPWFLAGFQGQLGGLMLLVAFFNLLYLAGMTVFWVILARALLSWFSQGRNPVDYVLMQLTEPLISPFRRIIPPMGGIDFSAMIVIFILYALGYLYNDIVQWIFM
ncbi:YggT family protein [Morganella morganii]|uniref:YggT family protein n=1 Tax=Morganella morganii TaxID=582 RepID=UPI0034E4D09F